MRDCSEKGPGLTKFCVVRKLIFAIRTDCFILARHFFFSFCDFQKVVFKSVENIFNVLKKQRIFLTVLLSEFCYRTPCSGVNFCRNSFVREHLLRMVEKIRKN